MARVDIAVDAKVPIRVDSEAVLAMQGITGGVLVEISRGTASSALLKPGVEIQSGYSPFERLLNGAPELIAKGNDLMDRVEEKYGIKIERLYSQLTPEAQAEGFGPELWARDPDQCCALRKVEPLKRKLATLDA